MAWNDQIFIYCERGQYPAFWAEPLNALTNGAFILAAVAATVEIARQTKGRRGLAEFALIGLVYVIGAGSFLFHTTAARWAQIADWGPIAIFMVAYLAYALRRFLGLNCVLIALCLALFIWFMQIAGTLPCPPGLLPVTERAGARCLNGSLAYAPALIALFLVALCSAVLRHPAWRLLFVAAIVFTVSATLRTLDLELCEVARFPSRVIGTHFLWHLLNALTLYLLLVAALRHGGRGAKPASAF
jgi:hypothetical protein